MNFIKRFFRQNRIDGRLKGSWESDIRDELTKKNIGSVTMTFTNDGKLIYDIKDGDKVQRMNLTYETRDGLIISDQPSNPRKEKTKYQIKDNDVLILEFEGQLTRFIRK